MVTHVALAEIGDGYRGGISHIKPLSANVIDETEWTNNKWRADTSTVTT